MDLRHPDRGIQKIVGNMRWLRIKIYRIVIDRRVDTVNIDELAKGKVKR